MGSGGLQIGVAGCGWVTEHWHLPALAGRTDARVVAVTDLDGARAQRVAQRFGIDRCHADVRALVEDPSVEAVAVCVPTESHAEVAALALQAGKHVLVEKPLALDVADCDRLIELEQRSGRTAMVGFNLRWHRLVRQARERLRAGAVGEPAMAQTRFTAASRYRDGVADWRKQRALGGGVIVDQAVHHFDLWRFLLGREVEEVFAFVRGDDEHVTVTARLAGGVLVDAAFSDGLTAANDVTVMGPRGRLELDCYRFDGLGVFGADRLPGDPKERVVRLGQRLRDLPEGLASVRRGGDHRDSYAEQWTHFAETVGSGGRPSCTLADGRRAVEIQLAVLESSATGKPVSISAAAEVASP